MSYLETVRTDAEKKFNALLVSEAGKIIRGEHNAFLPWHHKGLKITPLNVVSLQKDIRELEENCKEKIGKGYKLEWTSAVTRMYGTQSYIKDIVVDTAEDYAYLIKKTSVYREFCNAVRVLKEYFDKNGYDNDVLLVFVKNNLKTFKTEHDDCFWEGVVRCVDWFVKNPNSGLYMRQVPAEVGTKFIENNKTLLKGFYCIVKGVDGTDKDLLELTGLRDYSAPVHFRVNSLIENVNTEEQCLALKSFAVYETVITQAQIDTKIQRVIVMENHKTFLTFPIENGTMAIWGGGDSVNTRLKGCEWLKNVDLYYWGDIDEDGFGILYRFREDYPNSKSFLMDKETFQSYQQEAVRANIKENFTGEWESNLTEDEYETLKWLIKQREEKKKNRLEQELIPDSYIGKMWKKFANSSYSG